MTMGFMVSRFPYFLPAATACHNLYPKTSSPFPLTSLLRLRLLRPIHNLHSHSTQHHNPNILLPPLPHLHDLLTNLSVRHFDIIFWLPPLWIPQTQIPAIDIEHEVLLFSHGRHVHTLVPPSDFIVLLAGEDLNRRDDGLGVAVVAGSAVFELGDATCIVLDQDVAIFPELEGLGWSRERGVCTGGGGGRVVLGDG